MNAEKCERELALSGQTQALTKKIEELQARSAENEFELRRVADEAEIRYRNLEVKKSELELLLEGSQQVVKVLCCVISLSLWQEWKTIAWLMIAFILIHILKEPAYHQQWPAHYSRLIKRVFCRVDPYVWRKCFLVGESSWIGEGQWFIAHSWGRVQSVQEGMLVCSLPYAIPHRCGCP